MKNQSYSIIFDKVPGTIIHHVPAQTKNFVGCPSILKIDKDRYLASHSYFGKGSTYSETFIYESNDRGETWNYIKNIKNQIWSKILNINGVIYILGTDHCDNNLGRLNGKIVVRKSTDWGKTWSDVEDETTGLLTDGEGYHTAPTSVLVHNNRIWKAFEYAPEPDRKSWESFVISASADDDLLRRDSWTFSNSIKSWENYQWIEGNVVVNPKKKLVNILRTNLRTRSGGIGKEGFIEEDEPASIVYINEDRKTLEHDARKDRITFPGGGAKFVVKKDPNSEYYFSIVNPQDNNSYRNKLALSASKDLLEWKIIKNLLYHEDPYKHAFQYIDFEFDDKDIIFVSRTAFDDNTGGADNAHNANYFTFHRINNFVKYAEENLV